MPEHAVSPPFTLKVYSGGRSKSWVPRACDRCRKRKAKCGASTHSRVPRGPRELSLTKVRSDEAIPCQACSEAGTRCTHDHPVLKRGPRPRHVSSLSDFRGRFADLFCALIDLKDRTLKTVCAASNILSLPSPLGPRQLHNCCPPEKSIRYVTPSSSLLDPIRVRQRGRWSRLEGLLEMHCHHSRLGQCQGTRQTILGDQ